MFLDTAWRRYGLLLFASLRRNLWAQIYAAERLRGIRITEFEQRQLKATREVIDNDFAARNVPAATAPQLHLSGNQRT